MLYPERRSGEMANTSINLKEMTDRRRISGNIAHNPANVVSGTNAVVYRIAIDGVSNNEFMPTQSFRLKYARTDVLGTDFNFFTFVRAIDSSDLTGLQDVVTTDFGKVLYDEVEGTKQTTFKGAEITTPKANVYNSTTKQGVNGFIQSQQSFAVAKREYGEMYLDILMHFPKPLKKGVILELACIADTADAVTLSTNIHLDFVEL